MDMSCAHFGKNVNTFSLTFNMSVVNTVVNAVSTEAQLNKNRIELWEINLLP